MKQVLTKGKWRRVGLVLHQDLPTLCRWGPWHWLAMCDYYVFCWIQLTKLSFSSTIVLWRKLFLALGSRLCLFFSCFLTVCLFPRSPEDALFWKQNHSFKSWRFDSSHWNRQLHKNVLRRKDDNAQSPSNQNEQTKSQRNKQIHSNLIKITSGIFWSGMKGTG